MIDAAYRLDLAESQYLERLLGIMARRFEPKHPLFSFTSSLRDGTTTDCRTFVTAQYDGSLPPNAFDPEVPYSRAEIDRMYYRPPARHTLRTLFTRRRAATFGVAEFVGLNCPTGGGEVVVVGAVWRSPHAVSEGEHAYWTPVARHLASGLRLRRACEANIDAVFRIDGGNVRLEHAAGAARRPSLAAALRDEVIRRERARSGRRSTDGIVWSDLVCGRWSIIDRFERDGRRYVVAIHNPPGTEPLRALSRRERIVVAAVARGESNKAIAIDLGVSEATVSRTVRAAVAKLGIDHSELFGAVGATGDRLDIEEHPLALLQLRGPMEVALSRLSAGERATVDGVVRGQSNAHIAQLRGITVRTVSNQLASAFLKLGVRSRRELILMLLGQLG